MIANMDCTFFCRKCTLKGGGEEERKCEGWGCMGFLVGFFWGEGDCESETEGMGWERTKSMFPETLQWGQQGCS